MDGRQSDAVRIALNAMRSEKASVGEIAERLAKEGFSTEESSDALAEIMKRQ